MRFASSCWVWEGGIERGLGFFQFGQTLFVFGNLHRPLRQLGLLFFDV